MLWVKLKSDWQLKRSVRFQFQRFCSALEWKNRSLEAEYCYTLCYSLIRLMFYLLSSSTASLWHPLVLLFVFFYRHLFIVFKRYASVIMDCFHWHNIHTGWFVALTLFFFFKSSISNKLCNCCFFQECMTTNLLKLWRYCSFCHFFSDLKGTAKDKWRCSWGIFIL